MPKLTYESDRLFENLHKLVDELKEELKLGDLDSASASIDEISGQMGNLQDFLDYAEEAQKL